MCYYCYWGVPEAVAQIYETYDNGDGAIEYTCAHVVFGDWNLDDTTIKSCIESAKKEPDFYDNDKNLWHSDSIAAMEELLLIPEEERDIAEDGWNDEAYEKNIPPVFTRHPHERTEEALARRVKAEAERDAAADLH
jgi:hypothetical protein